MGGRRKYQGKDSQREIGTLFLFHVFSNGSGTGQRSESLLAGPANRTTPILRQVFEKGPLRDLALPVPLVGVVDITTVHRLALPHLFRFYHLLYSLLRQGISTLMLHKKHDTTPLLCRIRVIPIQAKFHSSSSSITASSWISMQPITLCAAGHRSR